MIPELKFNEKGLIPAIIQDAESNEVLMMAWMDKVALKKPLQQGLRTSGHAQGRSTDEGRDIRPCTGSQGNPL